MDSCLRSSLRGSSEGAVGDRRVAAREIADRIDSKARQRVEMSGGVTAGLAELVERVRKAKEAE